MRDRRRHRRAGHGKSAGRRWVRSRRVREGAGSRGRLGGPRTSPRLRANNTRDTYAFSDHPYPATADDYPTAEQVRAYLNAYADRFDIRRLIRPNSEVVDISREPAERGGHAGFQVTVRAVTTATSPASARQHFDFVAICNGVFSEPYVPAVAGMDRFSGRVVHSCEVRDEHLIEAQRVIVVGAGKSALDCATRAARRGCSCTLVFRAPHWMLPRYFHGSVRADRIILTRFVEAFLSHRRPSRMEALLHGIGKPLVNLWWRRLSRSLPRELGMPASLVPDAPLPAGFENIGIGGEFYQLLRQGRVAATRGRPTALAGTAIELDTGERLDADVVVFATGWRQSVRFLSRELAGLVERDDGFRLFRNILPPEEARLGFVGYASSSACQLTSEVAAHWLSRCFRGELVLPGLAEMESEISDTRNWISRVFPARNGGFFIGPYVAHYLDELMRDMGLATTRTSNPFIEFFAPLLPSRYQGLAAEGVSRRRSL